MEKNIIIKPGSDNVSRINVAEMILKPEETSETLVCKDADIFYYVLAGFGTLKVDVYGYDLEPQIAVFIPKGTPHTIKNTGAIEMFIVQYSA